MKLQTRHLIDSVEALRRIIPEPDEATQRTQIPVLDEHCRKLIGLSPFVFIATANRAGECDVSPKGDVPGFVRVVDERTLVIPDRKGNRRADSLLNIIENPHIGLLFMIPGVDWTLRVNGRASITADEDERTPHAVKGTLPDLAIVVDVEEVFLHCPRCILRARLWDTERWIAPADQPSFAEIMRDHTKYDVPVSVVEQYLDEHNRELY